MCYDERSMAKGGPGTMVGRTSLYWHHFGSGHLHLSCYLTSAESSPHCHYQVFLTPHLFVYFRVAKSRKKFKNLFLADLPSLENWDSSSSGKTLICLGHDYVPLSAHVVKARNWMSVGPLENRFCRLGVDFFMLGWDNTQERKR